MLMRIQQIENELASLKTWRDGFNVDFGVFALREELIIMINRVEKEEVINVVQEQRIKRLEQREDTGGPQKPGTPRREHDPDRLSQIEKTLQELIHMVSDRASLHDLRIFEDALLELRKYIDGFSNVYANRIDNEKDHKYFYKSLKHLYDLVVKVQVSSNDDAAFTTKGLKCAACAKGVHNLIGQVQTNSTQNFFPQRK
jgi:hypothetical protein